jgi:hypothetical protein
MSLEYLSGLSGPKRQAKKAARVEKKAVKRTALIEKQKAKGKTVKRMSPVTKTRVNKLQVQSKIRKAFVKKAEPIKVEEEEIKEEQEQPADFQASEETQPEETQPEETQAEETQAEEQAEEQADMGIFYPNFGKPKKKLKLKIKAPKLKGKLKSAVQKAKKRLKDDKHSPKEKISHQLAKQALFIPRGAFLAIMLLGKALEKSPIKINIGKKVAEVWDKKNKDIKEFWYKVGGEPDILEKQIKKFKSSKISGYLGVEPTTTAAAASITAASPIIVKFLKIVGKATEFAKKNPKLLAQGQALVNKGIKNVAEKNPEQLKSLNLVADEITKVLPPEQQAQINKIRTAIPKSTTDKIIKQAVTETKGIKQTTGTTPTGTPTGNKNKMLLIGGGAVALIGAYMLMKKKK